MPVDEREVRIMDQYRGRGGMVYDLKFQSTRLTLCMTAPNATESEWRIEARTSLKDDAFVVGGSGPTRREALEEVGRTWSEHATHQRVPPFDWEGAALALLAVRAI
jgi:hypothetical protein